jgi:hypothetical protein
MLCDGDAAVVLNLTPIQLHSEVSLAALAAGKHLYTEKPVAFSLADARAIVAAAKTAGRAVVCAPILEDRAPRAGGEQARHFIKIIEKVHLAAQTGVAQDVYSDPSPIR